MSRQHISIRNPTSHGDPSSRTDYKEGGSVEVGSLKHKYLNELQGSHYLVTSNCGQSAFPPHGTSLETEDRLMRASGTEYDEESSPEISETQQSVRQVDVIDGRGMQQFVEPSNSSLQTPAEAIGESGRVSDGRVSSSFTSQHQPNSSAKHRQIEETE